MFINRVIKRKKRRGEIRIKRKRKEEEKKVIEEREKIKGIN